MVPIEYYFQIVRSINCPLYQQCDRFVLSDFSIELPANRPACIILVRDMTELLLALKGDGFIAVSNQKIFSCSGCRGLIKFQRVDSAPPLNCDEDISLQGLIREFPPEELMQFLNTNLKTGTLQLLFDDGESVIIFKNGQIMSIVYGDLHNGEAFYSILRQKEGRFLFDSMLPSQVENKKPIGYFMNLLMEGLQKIDEDG